MSRISYREIGTGPPLVLIHGFCETSAIWTDFAEGLAAKFHVLMPDLPGFGGSESIGPSFSIDEAGDAIATWLQQIAPGKATMIGHSLGGYITLSIVERHPEIVTGFGLFHSTAFPDSEEKKENRNRVIEFVRRHGVQPYIDTFVPGLFFNKSHKAMPFVHTIASSTKQETLISYTQAMRERPDRTGMLKKNEISKILIAGCEDTLIPPQNSLEMAKMSENSTFYELTGVGHMGFFEDKTTCQRIITSFTERVNFNN